MNDAFKALADPTRRRILELLAESEKNAGDIADYFNISKPSISHHLSILKNADLISDERQGQNIVYTLNTTIFQDLVKWFFDFTKKEGIGGDESE
ncbi:transcriptional regulator [Anaerocolumna cellulosilytica]|uniref:Transcriptional regulator n=1 Tax=Anaerocolumna cellulosilytica TaxID=433286 RepID=A0A6S6QYB4_9FIRM|nr:autorepressor SdpR family transcription factor [Anaerocolumna cellulosilytica]MBB5196524.1 DNA-binding transcriptional ArsR family regulator [Anaerocolumna cellulosilytica]BCJ95624.1 transcriptional regulator [Anaerocolumna cellulosilytica]